VPLITAAMSIPKDCPMHWVWDFDLKQCVAPKSQSQMPEIDPQTSQGQAPNTLVAIPLTLSNDALHTVALLAQHGQWDGDKKMNPYSVVSRGSHVLKPLRRGADRKVGASPFAEQNVVSVDELRPGLRSPLGSLPPIHKPTGNGTTTTTDLMDTGEGAKFKYNWLLWGIGGIALVMVLQRRAKRSN
jgi:hypothetical protein